MEILKDLPAELPAAILIVQHITQGFEQGLMEWLGTNCKLPMRIPADNEEIELGTIYVAPSNLHMTVEASGRIRLLDGPPVNGLKPSGTVLFESVAKVFGERAIGVILTGMGSDGALGIKAIKEAGGFTIAQNESTSVVFGMPQVAIQLGKVDEVLALENIAGEIVKRLTLEGK
jgi:two-component system chemotaxis response regulator CheB